MRRFLHVALAATLCLVTASFAVAQTYPAKPIKLVVPYPPGGGSDSVGRLFAQKLSEKIGQPVIVENISGAGGSVGAALVAKTAPDGYTLLMGNTGPNAISPNLLKKVPYDVDKDFTPISVVASQPLFVLVDKASPYKTFADLVAAGKKEPGKLNFSSSGTGGLSHLAGELISSVTGAKFEHVPYKGGAPAMLAILSGDVVFHTPSAIDGVQQVAGGKMRGLVVTSAKRWPATPDIPTVQEAGYPDLEINFWYALFAPANLPAPVMDKLSTTTRLVLDDPATRKAFENLGSVATPTTSQELRSLVQSDEKRYAKVIATAGVEKQ